MLTATIFFFDAANGGRLNSPHSGFRPQIDVCGIHTSCVVESLSGEKIFSLGQVHKVSLRLVFPEHFHNAFSLGDSVCLFEGSKLIGKGNIVDL